MDAMTEVESEVIDMDDTEEVENEACLLGRLVAEKNWNPSNLIEDITKAWKPKHGMSSRELGESKLILFRFDDAIERDWVLKNQPWIFKGTLFAIEKFTVGNEQQLSSLVNVTVKHASFWARLYDVPFSCMNERSLRLFAKRIGILEFVDKWGEDLIGKFIRFKVSMNITKPLLRGITIHVKGEHLWLPLKYESLPIYCFSCGTIGHDHNECRSYNRSLEYSTLEFKENEEQKDTSTELPHDIVENILSRLPAKYLIRYKLVCKQWEATISDPRFAETHLQQYKNSSSQNLLAWEKLFAYYKGLYVAQIQDNHFRFVSGIQHSRKYSSLEHRFLCHCDGLYLTFFNTPDKGKTYLLWNPSCRAYKEIWCPQPIDNSETDRKIYGIYYNPLMKDYKVVMIDGEQYAVFSCRYNKWSEVKEMKDISCSNGEYWYPGVSYNGSVYWLTRPESVIICYDGEVEKFKKLPVPDCKEKPDSFELTCSGDHLYLFAVRTMEYKPYNKEIRIWKKNNGNDEKDLWMEHKVFQFGPPYFSSVSPVCWVNECEVILDIDIDYKYLLYDQSKNTCVEICKRTDEKYDQPVLYHENMFLQ